jgi:YD repeat-containing protein
VRAPIIVVALAVVALVAAGVTVVLIRSGRPEDTPETEAASEPVLGDGDTGDEQLARAKPPGWLERLESSLTGGQRPIPAFAVGADKPCSATTNDGSTSTTTLAKYDARGRPIETTIAMGDGEVAGRVEISYGDSKERIEFTGLNRGGVPSVIERIFDEQDRVRAEHTDLDGDGTFDGNSTFEYSSSGELTKKLTTVGHTEVVEEYVYDESGLLIREDHWFRYKGSSDDLPTRYEHRYEDGRRVETRITSGGREIIRVENRYDAAGRKIQEKTFSELRRRPPDTGIDREVHTTRYSYDATGRLASETLDEDDDGQPEKVTTYDYDCER